jgi:hypothetical protein
MRYFARENFDFSIHGLYRFEVSESGLIEQYWTTAGWHRDDAAKIVGYLAMGEGDLIELSLEAAMAHMPDAFNSPYANTIIQSPPIAEHLDRQKVEVIYRVTYIGSSLVGFSYGADAFEAARSFLQAKSDKGSAKCFHWWCETCKEKPFVAGDSPVDHFIAVSIPNVLAISQGHQVKWQWDNPESEWVKSRANTPEQEFQSLVNRKSRPNWKVIIQRYLE